MLGFQNTKTFLLNDALKIGQKKVLLLVKLKIQFRGLLLEVFMKKNYKNQIKKNLEQQKYLRKGDKQYLKWKGYNNSFNSWIDKKDGE